MVEEKNVCSRYCFGLSKALRERLDLKIWYRSRQYITAVFLFMTRKRIREFRIPPEGSRRSYVNTARRRRGVEEGAEQRTRDPGPILLFLYRFSWRKRALPALAHVYFRIVVERMAHARVYSLLLFLRLFISNFFIAIHSHLFRIFSFLLMFFYFYFL